MNKQNLSEQEKIELIAAVGGPAAARSIVDGKKEIIDRIPLYTEAVLGGAAYRPKNKVVEMLSDKGYLKDTIIDKVLLSTNYNITGTRQDLKFARVSPQNLGMTGGGFLSEIIAVALTRGLECCPQDTAAVLMLQMSLPWPAHGNMVVVSKAVIYEQCRYLFRISERRLNLATADGGHHWEPGQQFLFRRL